MDKKEPTNTVAEIMRMCEGADFKDLFIILDQFDQEKFLYTTEEANDILLFISHRRKMIESDRRWKEAKEKFGL